MNKIKYLFVRLLLAISPMSSRRLVVISLILPKLGRQLDEDMLDRLNDLLSVCDHPEIMRFSMSLSDDILDEQIGHIISEELSKPSSSTLSEVVYSALPEWLRYPHSTLKRDLDIISSFKLQTK